MAELNQFHVRLIDGKLYDPWDPVGPVPSPETVAHGLARLCRYGGHVQRFYSVAEHCIWVALRLACWRAVWHDERCEVFRSSADEIASGFVGWNRLLERIAVASGGFSYIRLALTGLIHDAPEGCGLVDVCGPVLRHEAMAEYKEAHNRCYSWLCEGWGLSATSSRFLEVRDVDRSILGAERAIRPVPSDGRYGAGEWHPGWPDLDLAVQHDLSILGNDCVRKLWIGMFYALKERAKL